MTSAPNQAYHEGSRTEICVLFDLRIPGAAEHLHRERAAWQEKSEIEAIDKNHFVFVVRPGGGRG